MSIPATVVPWCSRTGSKARARSPRSRGRGQRPQALLLTFFGAYLLGLGVHVATSSVLEVLHRAGVSEHATRSTLSRMARRNLLRRVRRRPPGLPRADPAQPGDPARRRDADVADGRGEHPLGRELDPARVLAAGLLAAATPRAAVAPAVGGLRPPAGRVVDRLVARRRRRRHGGPRPGRPHPGVRGARPAADRCGPAGREAWDLDAIAARTAASWSGGRRRRGGRSCPTTSRGSWSCRPTGCRSSGAIPGSRCSTCRRTGRPSGRRSCSGPSTRSTTPRPGRSRRGPRRPPRRGGAAASLIVGHLVDSRQQAA